MSDEDPLRRAWKAEVSPLSDRPDPDPERIWDALDGELSPEEVGELIDLTQQSPEWAEAWRLAVEMRRDLGMPIGAEPPSEETSHDEDDDATSVDHAELGVRSDAPDAEVIPLLRRPSTWVGAAGLAVAALALLAILPALQPHAPDAPTLYRATKGTPIELLTPADQALPRDAFELIWSIPNGDELSFDVVITDEDLGVIHSARDLQADRLRVPPAALSDLNPGTRLLWRVTARDVSGDKVGSGSGAVVVR
ncbi:MAG: hypothetical protein EA397_13060 [Deltaproteobacteria bacterium]|nr:MAG: hypothetical protein EA397_13060 [Deltaproteobacteria bacterium]